MGFEQAEDQIHRGGFAAAGGANQTHSAFGGDSEAEFFQRRLGSIGVAELDIVQRNGLLERDGILAGVGIRGLMDLVKKVDKFCL